MDLLESLYRCCKGEMRNVDASGLIIVREVGPLLCTPLACWWATAR